MGLQLPDWLVEALAYVGCTWPEADETKLYDAGNAWLNFADEAEKHVELATKAVGKMVEEDTSPGITAFEHYWAKVSGDDSYLADCRIVAGAVAIAFLSAALLVLVLKLLVIVQLIAMAIILAAAIAAAFFTLGASLAAAAEAAVSVNRAIVMGVNTTITAIRELGPPLTELARDHLGKEIQRLDGRPIHNSDVGVHSYKTPEEREQEERDYQRRKNQLAYDAAQGRSTPDTEREAEVALGLEATGRVKEPVTNSTDPRADFVDGNNQPWDVKGFLTHPDPNRTYNRTRAERKILGDLNNGEYVALDTGGLSQADFEDLKDLVASHPEWRGKVVIY
ncbi:hypothetical protein ABZV93_19395 [Actinopolymorpha sp. NPDC004070]|uniref:WXG100-like domain-containing protein n=1 Tax=Actinopolymorpha sp. NPDC004070 TaxID=3154548 RepID=UPI0033A0AB2D